MKDPKRINKIIDILKSYWNSHPDLRLGQILSNIASSCGEGIDTFYLEDDVLKEKLITLLKGKK